MCPPLGVVHSLRAEAGRQAENQQARLGSSTFTRFGDEDSRQDPETPRPSGISLRSGPGWEGVSVTLLRTQVQAVAGGGTLCKTVITTAPPGLARRGGSITGLGPQAACLRTPPTPPHAHSWAQTCTHMQTDVPGLSPVCPHPQLLHCDLGVVTALPPGPFLWDTRMWAHTCTHTHTGTPTLPGSNHHPQLTHIVPNTSLHLNLRTSAHICIWSWGTVARPQGPL